MPVSADILLLQLLTRLDRLEAKLDHFVANGTTSESAAVCEISRHPMPAQETSPARGAQVVSEYLSSRLSPNARGPKHPTNLYLSGSIRSDAEIVCKKRYGVSLSVF